MVVHTSDAELGLALRQCGRLRDLIRAEVDPQRLCAYRRRPPGDVAVATAELHVPIAGLEPGSEKKRACAIVMDLADRPEPRMTGLASIENVLVTVGRHRGGRLTQLGDVYNAGAPRALG